MDSNEKLMRHTRERKGCDAYALLDVASYHLLCLW